MLYLEQTYRDFLAQTRQPLYISKQVQVPEPESYVIYTGERQECPKEFSLSREFFVGKNVLKEYLESREKEAVDIMMVLYDEEEAMRTYVESERYSVQNDTRIEMARDMLRDGELVEKIIR